jgi:hypothetical protein
MTGGQVVAASAGNNHEWRPLVSLCREKDQAMKATTFALVLGTALALSTMARADQDRPSARLIRVPVVTPSDPFWVPDYNIVPRYSYRPQDDRVDTSPNARPMAPSDGDFGGTGGSGW